jgi:hypothetical protein
MAERSIAAVLKTVEGQTSGGSNPSLSAEPFLKWPSLLSYRGFSENEEQFREQKEDGISLYLTACLTQWWLLSIWDEGNFHPRHILPHSPYG